jgi:hypothetical protein
VPARGKANTDGDKMTQKAMTIAESIAVSVNVSLKQSITGGEIVKIFHSGTIPAEYIPNIGILFAEVHTARLSKLFTAYDISRGKAQKIYESISDFYHSRQMEKFLYRVMGKTA